jgi:hypothetical protein
MRFRERRAIVSHRPFFTAEAAGRAWSTVPRERTCGPGGRRRGSTGRLGRSRTGEVLDRVRTKRMFFGRFRKRRGRWGGRRQSNAGLLIPAALGSIRPYQAKRSERISRAPGGLRHLGAGSCVPLTKRKPRCLLQFLNKRKSRFGRHPVRLLQGSLIALDRTRACSYLEGRPY